MQEQVEKPIAKEDLAAVYYEDGYTQLNECNNVGNAIALFEQAMSALAAVDDESERGKLEANIHWQFAYARLIENDFKASAEHILSARAMYAAQGDLLGIARITYVDACVQGRQGRLQMAKILALQSMEDKKKYFGEACCNIELLRGMKLLADLEAMSGNPDETDKYYDAIIQLSAGQQAREFRIECAWAHASKGWFALRVARLDEAGASLSTALAIIENETASGDFSVFLIQVYMAQFYLLDKKPEQARLLLDKASALVKAVPENYSILLDLAFICYQSNTDVYACEEALRCIEIKLAAQTQILFDTLGFVHRELAKVYCLFSEKQKQDLGRSHLVSAYQLYKEALGAEHLFVIQLQNELNALEQKNSAAVYTALHTYSVHRGESSGSAECADKQPESTINL